MSAPGSADAAEVLRVLEESGLTASPDFVGTHRVIVAEDQRARLRTLAASGRLDVHPDGRLGALVTLPGGQPASYEEGVLVLVRATSAEARACAAQVAVAYDRAPRHPHDAQLERMTARFEPPVPDQRFAMLAAAALVDAPGAWRLIADLQEEAEELLHAGPFASELPPLTDIAAYTLASLLGDEIDYDHSDIAVMFDALVVHADKVSPSRALADEKVGRHRPTAVRVANPWRPADQPARPGPVLRPGG